MVILKRESGGLLPKKQGNASPGTSPIFLPPCSPDPGSSPGQALNRIEMALSKLKTLLRKGAARTCEALWNPVGSYCNRFLPKECPNDFKAAGYGVD